MKKTLIFLFGAAMISIVACNKKAADEIQPASKTFNPSAMAKHGSDDTTGTDDRGGHGNDDSAGHNNAEIIKDFKLGSSSLKATRLDSMQLILRNPAPATGYTVTFTSSDLAVQPPASLTIAAGATTKYVRLTSTAVRSSRRVTVTATINRQSESGSFNLLP